ncbi:MAG: hypothetical protein FD180_164 [Planctomycetota bacterium]|nr:MAG: hypothetical protein FD180_164 [Planctomycetota bacterium]
MCPQTKSRDVNQMHLDGDLPHPFSPEATEEFSSPPESEANAVEAGHSAAKPRARWPAPLGSAALIGIAGDFVNLVEPQTESDPAAVLIQFLLAFGGAVGRGAFCTVGETAHYLNEYAVICGRSSRARKGTSFDATLAPFALADREWTNDHVITGGLSSGEGIIYHVRDPIPPGANRKSKERPDKGVADKRLFVVESEFASVLRVLRREGNTLSPVIRNGWDGKTLRTLTRTNPLRASGAHLSILGHITDEELLRHLDDVEIANGFANRFMFFAARRSKILPEGGRIPAGGLEEIGARLGVALAGAKGMGEIKRNLAACQLWGLEYPRLTRDVPGLLGSILARAEAHVLRLSAMYAALDGTSSISPDHLRAGLEVWRYAEDSARTIFGESLGSPFADELLAHLRGRSEGLTRTDIRDLFSRHSSEKVTKALEVLAGAGLAELRLGPSSGGRRPEVWHALQPTATKATEATNHG